MSQMRKVLIVSGVPSHPPTAGSRERIVQLAEVLKEIDCEPRFLFQDLEDGDVVAMREWWGDSFSYLPYRANKPKFVLKRWARRFPSLTKFVSRLRAKRSSQSTPTKVNLDEWYDPALSPLVNSVVSRQGIRAIILEYVFFSQCLTGVPKSIRTVIDTIELFSIGRNASSKKPWADIPHSDEITYLRRADKVWTIQDQDEAAVRSELGENFPVVTVGHRVPENPCSRAGALHSDQILVVASNHHFNLQGLRWFAEKVYPTIRDAVRADQVTLVGSAGDALRGDLPFKCLGRVKNLREYYEKARVVICPILDGTGLKIKAVEALGMGRPLVITRSGATGLESGAGESYLRADSPQEFGAAIRMVLDSDEVCHRLMVNSERFIRNMNQSIRQAVDSSLFQS